MSRGRDWLLAMALLMAVPLCVFVVAGGSHPPGDIAIVRVAMASQVGSRACSQSGGVVSCDVVGGADCRYWVFTGMAATRVYNGFRSPPAAVRFAVLGRCTLHGRPDGGTVGYVTSSA